MAKLTLFLCILAGVILTNASYHHHTHQSEKHTQLSSNRTPKVASIFSNACDECQLIIKKIAEIAQDPTKINELKVLLGILCHETSYEDECKMFVSRIDLFLKQLLPYLGDPKAACQKLHICSNSKIEQFHRVGLLYAKKYLNKAQGARDLVCEECQFAAHELFELVDDEEYQKEVKTFLSENVCARLGGARGSCDEALNLFLPELWTELHEMLQDDKKFCQDLGLCQAALGEQQPALAERKTSILHSNGALYRLMKKLSSLRAEKDYMKIGVTCFECRLLVDSLAFELRKNATVYDIADDLRGVVCPFLPGNMFEGCESFMEMYAPTVVYMTIGQFNSESICIDAHLCNKKTYEANSMVHRRADLKSLKCESCKAISDVLVVELNRPEVCAALITDIRHYLCARLPDSLFYICENLTKSYVPIIITRLEQKLYNEELCYMMRACKY